MAELIFSTSNKNFDNVTVTGVSEITGNTYVRYNNTGNGNWIRVPFTVPNNKKWTITQIFTSYTSFSSYNAGYGFTKEARTAYSFAKNSTFDHTASIGTYGTTAGNTYTTSKLNITLGSGTWYLYVYVADQGGAWQYVTPNTKLKLTYTEETDLTESTAVVPNFTMGSKGSIIITRSSPSLTHKLTVKIGEDSYEIASNVATSFDWTPDVATWGPRVPNATSTKCTMVVDTYNGGTLVGSSEAEFTLSVPASVVPTISAFTTQLVNDNATVNGWGVAVKGYTKIKWSITADGASGSTISKYEMSAGGINGSGSSGTSAVMTATGKTTPTATVTDSRGRTATATAADIVVEDYKEPSITSAKAERCNEDGSANSSGAFVKLTFAADIASVAGKNTATYQYRSKTANGSYSSWKTFQSGTVISGFSTTMTYVIELRVIDALGKSRSTEQTITTREEWLHGKEGGKGAAFGKVAETDNLLDVAWDLRVRGNTILDTPLPLESGGLGTTSLDAVLDLLGINIKVVTAAGTDLNNYMEPGWYYFSGSTNTPTNIPNGINGWLHVIRSGSSGAVKQIWYRFGTPGTNDQETFVRTYSSSTGWGGWSRYYTSRDISTIKDSMGFDYTVIKDLGRLDLSGAVTTKQVFDAMPKYSICIMTSSKAGTDYISDVPTQYSLVEFVKANTYGHVRASKINTTLPEYYFGSWHSTGGFSGWSTENPLMTQNIEYVTTEMWNGKRVYTKLVNCGAMTNGSTFTYSTETVFPIRYSAYCNNHALPVFLSDGFSSTWKLWIYIKNSVITAFMGSSWSSANIYAQVWYIK